MSMEVILREKRKSLGLTQEQVANYLGVTTPAVNKWEKGITCPDIALLPALARLLKTDPNTLLNFQESLSHQEIGHFLNDVAESIRKNGVEQGFALAIEKLQEYPNCAELLHSTAMVLDGSLMMSGFSAKQKERYLEKVMALYERVAKSDDLLLANQARYMLASKLIERKQYAKAQEMLDLLPDWNALDKRGMQADVLSKQGETARAAELLERKLMLSVQDHQATLVRLIQLAVQEGNEKAALSLADCAQQECAAFRLGEYWSHIAPLEAAVARKDISGSMEALTAILGVAAKPWNNYFSPLFCHIPCKESSAELSVQQLLDPLLSSLEQAPEYEFLRTVPEFQELVESYRTKCTDG